MSDDGELAEQKVRAKRVFRSPDDAAVDVLNRIAESMYESGGVVYRDKRGQYSYSAPMGNQQTGKFEATAQIPQSAQLSAIYHTHPDGPQSELFSPEDVNLARDRRLQSYIKVMKSGDIRRFDPKSSSTRPLSAREFNRKVSEGERVVDSTNQEIAKLLDRQ